MRIGARSGVWFALVLLGMMLPCSTWSESALQQCIDQFVGGSVSNAPTILGSLPTEPFGTNIHLCYRVDDRSFFALEYWPEQFAPRWVAYKLSPENYGSDGCATFTRARGNCYFREPTWARFLDCERAGDPFHSDHMLTGRKLAANDFASTGHDRGHLAPRQSFSWHVCGAYQTFTMANMSPQRPFLNQAIWAHLEQQVLTWAFDGGPLYVVTGTTYRRFPHQLFQVYLDGVLDPNEIYGPGDLLEPLVHRHQASFAATQPGNILRPMRDANPERIRDRVRAMQVPTGYFKVAYRREMRGERSHAIGFLLPHSFENLNLLTEGYPGMATDEAFWAFTSRIDVIERAGGITFPWLSEELKVEWGSEWFFSRRDSRNISAGCIEGEPQGALKNSTREERVAACVEPLLAP
jgi:hypothetical protein